MADQLPILGDIAALNSGAAPPVPPSIDEGIEDPQQVAPPPVDAGQPVPPSGPAEQWSINQSNITVPKAVKGVHVLDTQTGQPFDVADPEEARQALIDGRASLPVGMVDVPVVSRTTGEVGSVSPADLAELPGDWMLAPQPVADDWDQQGDEIAVVDKNGQVGSVLKPDLQAAFAEGWKVATRDERMRWDEANPTVFVVDPEGKVDAISRTKFKELAPQGWVKASEEQIAAEYGDKGSQTGALAEGFAQGLTTHIYKPALSVFAGDDYVAEMDARQRFNPTTSVVGEVGGALTQAILTNGAGLGQVARGAAVRMAATQGPLRGAVMRVAGELVAGAVDAASFGAAQRTMDSLTGDHPADAESILMGAANDALWGAALGGAGGAAIEAGSAAVKGARSLFSNLEIARELRGKPLPDALQTITDKSVFKTIIGGSNKKAARKAEKAFGTDGDAILGRWATEAGVPLNGTQAEIVDSIEALNKTSREAQASLVERLDATGVRPDTDSLAAGITDHMDELLSSPSTEGAARKAFRNPEFRPIYDAVMRNDGTLTFNELWKARQTVDGLAKFNAAAPTDVSKAFRGLRNKFEDAMATMADDVAARAPSAGLDVGEWQGLWQKAKDDTRKSFMLLEAAKDGLAGQQGNNGISLRAAIYGAAGGGALGVAGALAGDELGSALGLGGTGVGGLVSTIAAQALISRGPRIRTRGLQALTNAARKGGADSIVRGIDKARSIASVSARRLEDTLLRGPRVPDDDEKGYSSTDDKSVSREVERAKQVLSGGDAADQLDDAAEVIADSAGIGVAMAFQDEATRRAQYLTDLASSGNPEKVTKAVAVMREPNVAMKRLAEGRATTDEVDAIKVLYPRAYEQLRRKAIKAIAQPGANRKVVARLKRLFDVPTDPAQLMAYQATAQAAQQSQQAKASGMGPSANVTAGLASPSSGGSLRSK